MTATRIDLGLAGTVRLGRLTLNPPVRAIRRDDGAEEVVEPRVMQVLLALAEAQGGIVRREELTERCWEGRVVGEDAINRVLSRLRRVAEGIGADSFRIETITKIGYRLVALNPDGAAAAPQAPAAPPTASPVAAALPPRPATMTRRMVMRAGAGVGIGTLAGGGAWWALHRRRLPKAAREAMERGMNAMRLQTPEQMPAAVAAFREATRIAPDAAEPWGKLALAYRWRGAGAHGPEFALDSQRSREAADKALQIDPDNSDAQVALIQLPQYRNWLAYDRAYSPILARHPDEIGIGLSYIGFLSNVGRIRELNAITQRLMARDKNWPALCGTMILSSWCLGRLDEADAAMDWASQTWPRDLTLWFTRQRVLAYSGRGAAALAMIDDVDNRPVGLPAWDFDLSRLETQALITRAPADVDAAAAAFRAQVGPSVGVTSNAGQFFAAVGRMDDAFAMFDALYFDKGFTVGTRAFTAEQGTYNAHRIRQTWYFWLPFMAPLRADPRTAAIMEGVGLSDYWRKSGKGPDFPIAGYKPA